MPTSTMLLSTLRALSITLLALSPSSPVLKVVIPLLGIIVLWLVTTRRYRLSMTSDLQLVWPQPGPLLLWLGLAMAWMLATDYLLNWRGAWDFAPWQAQPLWVSAARILGVVMLGPILEELLFRGLLYYRLQRTQLPEWASIVVLAATWAVLHQEYSGPVITIIFIEGLLLGAARRYSGSLVVPILMHMAWNAYAVW